MKKRNFIIILSIAVLFTTPLYSAGNKEADKKTFDTVVHPFLDKYCTSCHGEKKDKGDIRLHQLSHDLASSKDLEQWQLVLKQLEFNEMPPKKKTQPASGLKKQVVDWINSELSKSGQMTAFKQKMQKSHYGNFVNHDRLFSGEIKEEAFSPARLWRRSPYDFDIAKVHLFGIKQKRHGRKPVLGSPDNKNVTQPFQKADGEGISDYAALLYADSSTFDSLFRNAEYIVDKTLRMAFVEMEYQSQGKTIKDWQADRAKVLQAQKDIEDRYVKEGRTPRYIRGMHREINQKYGYQTPKTYRDIIFSKSRPSKSLIEAAIRNHYFLTVQREPTKGELAKYTMFMEDSIRKSGNYFGLRIAMIAIMVSPEFIYRSELGLGAKASHGRYMLSSTELAFAISYALTDTKPDQKLMDAAKQGKLKTRQDIETQVKRLLEDESVEKPRTIRFFQEFFGYHHAPAVFKDEKRFAKGYTFFNYAQKYVTETDVLINYILKKDKNVFKELLTTDKYFVAHSGDNKEVKVEIEAYNKMFTYFKKLDWKSFNKKIPKNHQKFIQSLLPKFKHLNGRMLQSTMKHMIECEKLGITSFGSRDKIDRANYLLAYNLPARKWDFAVEQPFVLAKGKRAGILSHPSWLIAHSLNSTTDPVRRGKWIRERLLAGTIPDVPITVDAVVPEDHTKTLRERYAVTEATECWKCHAKMNPLGYAFETFDDFGRWRDQENMEGLPKKSKNYQTKPVNSKGYLHGTGDKSLDGEVVDAVDLVNRLAKSRRVQQSFIRHAFRYWMGRNELFTDSQTLIRAEKAYVDNGGSFKALMISLLTSDSFIYRKRL
jgi:hypothetical protein